jgi:hypothetical protein
MTCETAWTSAKKIENRHYSLMRWAMYIVRFYSRPFFLVKTYLDER